MSLFEGISSDLSRPLERDSEPCYVTHNLLLPASPRGRCIAIYSQIYFDCYATAAGFLPSI